MAGAGPLTPAELAKRTGTTERYVREWLQRAGRRRLRRPTTPATRHATRCRPSRRSRSPTRRARRSCCGAFQVIDVAACATSRRSREAFTHRRRRRLARAPPRPVRGHRALLPPRLHRQPRRAWIPALDGVEAKLERGAKVADVGCGHGASTILMAQGVSRSRTFVGFDYHAGVDRGRARSAPRTPASPTACASRSRRATDYPGHGYDLVAHLRLPARHGRSGRRRAARARDARSRTAPG